MAYSLDLNSHLLLYFCMDTMNRAHQMDLYLFDHASLSTAHEYKIISYIFWPFLMTAGSIRVYESIMTRLQRSQLAFDV